MKLGELLEGEFFTEYIKKGTMMPRLSRGYTAADGTQETS
jgi:hypothetical protein